ncbi:MAG: GNAT family N-acetyltransferase [Butyricicoccus pullicaecorum]|nr:GNAT family N-acetyltransferase [Butyricicoccus pullicaecorum]
MMKQSELIIRAMQPEEYPLLREFLYQAIFLPEGTVPPSRSVIDLPELQIYIADFGTQFGDHCLAAEVNGKIVGTVWSRIMADYGHIDKDTPSLAISLLPEYRGQGIGTKLLNDLLSLLCEKGFRQVSLSVQKKNPAVRLYKRAGFQILEEKGAEYLMFLEYPRLEIQLAQTQDIDAWMELVERVKDSFPGLETQETLDAHKTTVLHFMENASAICAVTADHIAGTLLFSKEDGMLCFLAVDPVHRRQHIAQQMISFMLTQMDAHKDITVSTYREGDPNGIAARALYKSLGFSAGKLTEEFGYPVQEFILKR